MQQGKDYNIVVIYNNIDKSVCFQVLIQKRTIFRQKRLNFDT